LPPRLAARRQAGFRNLAAGVGHGRAVREETSAAAQAIQALAESGRTGVQIQQVVVGLADLSRFAGTQHVSDRDLPVHQVRDPTGLGHGAVFVPVQRPAAQATGKGARPENGTGVFSVIRAMGKWILGLALVTALLAIAGGVFAFLRWDNPGSVLIGNVRVKHLLLAGAAILVAAGLSLFVNCCAFFIAGTMNIVAGIMTIVHANSLGPSV